jgi:DNA-binding NarL/FixJ family response regulator
VRLPASGRSGDWPAAALTLAASTSPNVVIVDLGLPDVSLATVALLAGLTAAFAATDVTGRLSPPSRHR